MLQISRHASAVRPIGLACASVPVVISKKCNCVLLGFYTFPSDAASPVPPLPLLVLRRGDSDLIGGLDAGAVGPADCVSLAVVVAAVAAADAADAADAAAAAAFLGGGELFPALAGDFRL